MKALSIYAVFIVFIIIVSFLNYASATHTSKPIITLDRQTYGVNENVTVTGWVEYQNNPASNVLLDIVINEADDGNELSKTQTRSNDLGNFSSSFIIPADTISGNYTLTVISQCKDEHRDICTNQNSSIPVSISN
jgi:hypothetical protein